MRTLMDTVVGSYLESASAEEKADMIEAVSSLVKDGTLTSFVLVRLPSCCILLLRLCSVRTHTRPHTSIYSCLVDNGIAENGVQQIL